MPISRELISPVIEAARSGFKLPSRGLLTENRSALRRSAIELLTIEPPILFNFSLYLCGKIKRLSPKRTGVLHLHAL
ncbi:hypothetical protein IQ270_05185 [Microcoleus sp. LEGE 07076]|uniref:hypothetical protein n=1 Tax=Microcoleus sp. LEGE 07076 TaxID=915322 RepID=UPI00187E3EA9|nr:hypothetical protein [Microcoleus sp. LEGE 07076]MBE9184128.1 hypothetical protein [Microcoleus sp. LEGE 07076]